MSPRAALDDAHLETIRELAAAPDRPEAEVTEITLRAALAEAVDEIDRLRSPPVGGFELRGFSPGPGGTWERIAHPGAVRLEVAVVHPDLVGFDLRRPYSEWPETVRALIEQRQSEAGAGD